MFKGKQGNFEIKRTRKGWIFKDKDTESDIDTKDWRFEDLKFSVIRINEILGVGGEGFVYYDSKLNKAVKIVQKHSGSKRKYKIEHDKWRSGQFSGKLDDLVQELKRYGKGFNILISSKGFYFCQKSYSIKYTVVVCYRIIPDYPGFIP